MTEDTVDLSKGKTLDGDSIENPKSDTEKALGDTKPVGQPIENYDERGIGDTLEAMHHAAVMAAASIPLALLNLVVPVFKLPPFSSGPRCS